MTKQDYGTPPEFLAAVARRFGPIDVDLAARADNAVAANFITPERDSLTVDWTAPNIYTAPSGHIILAGGERSTKVAWLNPPFANIRPWAAKAAACRYLPRWTLMLVPASMGSGWWRDHVLGQCQADGVPRMKFVGCADVFPKDLAILAFGYGVAGNGYWDWRL